MVNVTDKYKEYIQKPNRYFKSKVIIRDKEYIDDTIIEMNQEESVNPGDDFTLGSVSSTSFNITLNEDIEFLETATLKPYIGLDIDGNIEYIPLGIFNVDDVSRKNKTIKIECFDNMIKLEQAYFSDLVYPAKIQDVALEICNKAGVKFNSTLPDYSIEKLEEYSLREAIGFIASLCCGFAKFNRYGELEIKFYKDNGLVITPDNYFNFETGDKGFKISKVTAKNDKEIISIGNEEEFGKEISFENPIITKPILQDIYDKLNSYTYIPYTLKWQGDIALEAGDSITIVDLKGKRYKTLVMQNKISYKGGLSGESKAVGKTEQGNKFDSNGSTGNKINRLVTEQAYIKEALINTATIDDLKATNAKIENLNVETGKINNLLAGNITAENIATGAITASSGIIAEGAIGDAQISSLSANKIQSGTVDTSLVTIASKDNSITITGNQLMVNEGESNRVILGKYNIGDKEEYGLLVRKEDGKTTILDGDGVHNAGLTSDAVRDNVVADDANILGHKLNINSVVREINNKGTETIKGTKVQVGDRTLDIELSTQQNTINDQGKELVTQKSQIKAMDSRINLKIDTQKYNKDMEGVNTSLNKNTTELGLLKDQINLKVSGTEVDKKISEINIGGRNLVRNSSGNLGDISYWGIQSSHDKNGYDGSQAIVVERGGVAPNTPRTFATQELSTKKIFLKDEIFTLSAWVYLDSSIPQDKENEIFLRCYYENQFMDICKINIPLSMQRDKWHFVKIADKASRDFDKITINLALGLNGKMKCSRIMLVEGAVFPYWTPALEDLEYTINKYTDGKITTINNSITSLSSEVNVLKREINLKVSSSEVDTKINEITLGTRNYYRGSNKELVKTNAAENTNEIIKLEAIPLDIIQSLQGQKVTVSVDVEVKNAIKGTRIYSRLGTELSIRFEDGQQTWLGISKAVNTGDNFKERISVTYTFPTKKIKRFEFNNIYIQCGGEYLKVGYPKLELGNKATDWSPAPEDIYGEINKVETNINQKISEIKIEQDKITSTVSSVQGTLSNKADKGQLTGLESKLTQTVDAFKFEFNKKINNNVTVINEDGVTVSHEDGSFTRLESKGLRRYTFGEAQEYFYLSDMTTRDIEGHVPESVYDDFSFFHDYWYLTLPDKYKGKQPKFWVTLSNINGQGDSAKFISKQEAVRVIEWVPSLARVKIDVAITGIHYYSEKIDGRRLLVFDDFSPATQKKIDYTINVMAFA